MLFTATCAVMLLLERTEKKWKGKKRQAETFLLKDDPIAMTAVRILLPVIIMIIHGIMSQVNHGDLPQVVMHIYSLMLVREASHIR